MPGFWSDRLSQYEYSLYLHSVELLVRSIFLPYKASLGLILIKNVHTSPLMHSLGQLHTVPF